MILAHSLLGLLIASCGTASSIPPLGDQRRAVLSALSKRASNCSTASLYADAPSVTAPKKNVWSAISPEDNFAVWNLLHDPKSGLNLTLPAEAKINDNYVWFIDTIPVNKSAALPYIDGSGAQPSTYARAIIFEGGKTVPVSQEYMIGPLPVSSETTIQKFDYAYNGGSGGSLPFNGRYQDSIWIAASDYILLDIMSNLTDVTTALLDGVWYGNSDNRSTLTQTSTTPSSLDGSNAWRVIMFKKPGTANYLRPLDFFVLIECPGTDASHYKLKGIVTNTRFFTSVAEVRAAFDAGELTEDHFQPDNDDWALLNINSAMGTRDLEEKLAPQNVELGGKRYRLDTEQKYVEYMGWSFYVAHSRTLGLSLHDVRFKGERILYELSMQEAAAQYGGFQPKSATTVYHDTYYSLGADLFPLLEGFDCPFGSSFWNLTVHSTNTTNIYPNAVCIFESDAGFPLSRHRAGGTGNDWGFRNFGVVKGSMLTLRAIATVGNYDYLFDYAFHVDGSLEITVRASGYLQSSFYYKDDQGKWGPRIQEATQGSLHDHVITFKADFDIINSNNTLQATELVAAPTEQPWWPELGVFEQIQLNSYNMKQEQKFNWADNGQTMFAVNHASKTNKWGTPRGYRIVPGKSNIHLSTLKSPLSLRNSDFLKSHLAVTQHHDTEPWANSVQNLNMPGKPQQDFAKMFNNESVENEDIVVWFNLGMHHFTRSEDVPVTLYTEAVSSIMLAPQNFFDQAQDGDIQNRRWILPSDDGTSLVTEAFGVQLPQCPLELREPIVPKIIKA